MKSEATKGWKRNPVHYQIEWDARTNLWTGRCEDRPRAFAQGPCYGEVKKRLIAEIHEMSFETYITPEYRLLQRKLHDASIDYGMSARAYASTVLELIRLHDFKSVLDYGCGKGSLRDLIFALAGLDTANLIKEYDPAIWDKDRPVESAELVVCIDVLEHVEPEKLDFVLRHIRRMGWRMFFATVSLIPATKTLEDGRNAHLIIKPQQWWLDALLDHWDMRAYYGTEKGFVFVGVPK